MAIGPDGTMYTVTRHGVFVSRDDGDHWSLAAKTGGESTVWAITISPSGRLYFGGTILGRAAVYMPNADNTRWTGSRIDSALRRANSLVVDSHERVYAGAKQGVYRSTSNGGWELLGKGLEGLTDLSMAVDSTDHLLVGTQKDGVYRSQEPICK
jgi:ligand-binding sensor domain-containing protein